MNTTPPHFHVKYENFRASIDINSLGLIDGKLPPKVLSLVIEWASLHREELMKNWQTIIESGNFNKIKPLV